MPLMISYAPFWDTLSKKGISQYELINTYNVDNHLLHSLRTNRNITMLTVERLCNILNCRPNDIVKFDD